MSDQRVGAAGSAISDSTSAATGPTLVQSIIYATGTYSVEICRPDAELSPPQYLLDAWQAAADRIEALEQENEALGGVLNAATRTTSRLRAELAEAIRKAIDAAMRAAEDGL